jgi:PDZ domain-containing secreted protein
MWSYECAFEHPKKPKKITKKDGVTGVEMSQTNITIAADSSELALQFAMDELKKNEDYELVGIIRRNAIVAILKENT